MPDKEFDPTLAEVVGSGFAVVQHGMDRVIEWGFAKLKETGEKKEAPSTPSDNPTVRRVAKAGRSTMKFIGRMGDAYYKTYGELKRK